MSLSPERERKREVALKQLNFPAFVKEALAEVAAHRSISKSSMDFGLLRDDVYNAINAERRRVNAPELLHSEAAQHAAQLQVGELIRTEASRKERLTHENRDNPQIRTLRDRLPNQRASAENLALLSSLRPNELPEQFAGRLVGLWMNSEPHRRALLDPTYKYHAVVCGQSIQEPKFVYCAQVLHSASGRTQ